VADAAIVLRVLTCCPWVATDPDSLDPTAERIAALIASGGIDQAMARDLAAKIIDYERCMEHQRA